MIIEFSIRRKRKVQDTLNITPLIDVVFILLIFFMLTSTFKTDRGIDVSLPSSETAEQQAKSDRVFTVSIDDKGEVFVEKKKVTVDGLVKRVQLFLDKNKEGKIILRSDAKVQVQKLVTVMDKLKQAQATNITLAATGIQ